MGLFDRFKGDKEGAKAPSVVPAASPAAKWADKAGDKRAQNYDRQEAIGKLAEMHTADAAAALLRRFTFNIDPSITDQEEKDAAFNGVLAVGKDAIEPVRAFSEKAESLAWPMKILKELLDETEFVEELVMWLSRWDTEYRKFIDPKLQILTILEEHKHPKIRLAVEPFLQDVNEPARFHSLATTLAQEDAEAVGPLVDALEVEESYRVKMKLAEGLLLRGWVVPEEKRAAVRKGLPPGFSVDAEGKVKRR